MSRQFTVAVVGATGAVGRKMIDTLEKHQFPVGKLRAFASARSAGTTVEFRGEDITVEELRPGVFAGVDIALFSAGGGIATEYAPLAAAQGAIVIDNSSAWRMDPDVPLVVPEVNPQDIAGYKTKGIIANPNCSTIQMVVALKPLHDLAHIKRIVVSTYQSVSGAGQTGIEELETQVRELFNMKDPTVKKFPHRIAFNCIPQIDVFLENGYTKEEMKMVNETRKIMGDPTILVSPTTVRVPVFYGHAESVNVEFEKPVSVAEARAALEKAPGVLVVDDPASSVYPLQIHCADREETFVGRLRKDDSVPFGLNLWVVSDNLMKGAALNAVQIAEVLAAKYLT
jgi:aspartate-semialdehyde dehydrogenase